MRSRVFFYAFFIGMLFSSASSANTFADENFIKAVRDMDANGIVASLKEGADINARDSRGNTALIITASKRLFRRYEADNILNISKFLIDKGYKVLSYHLLEYWLDIGKMEDFKKAKEDIKHLKLLDFTK